jgi:hypothetical protein
VTADLATPEPDPADVAAGAPAASSLLGSAAPTPGAGTDGRLVAGPADALPAVGGSSPVAPGSRYAGVSIARLAAGGRTIPYFRRRWVPQPEELATSGWEQLLAGDRADLVAARALGDPTAFWQLCDGNLVFDPAELELVGRLIRLTLPGGFPGDLGG